MHRIDGDGAYPTGHWSEGDPAIPRLPTQITAAWMEDVQEELAQLVTTAGGTLAKGVAQLKDLLPMKLLANTWSALQTFTAGVRASNASGPGVEGKSESDGVGGEFWSYTGLGLHAWSSTGAGAKVVNYSDAHPALEAQSNGAQPAAYFHSTTGLGLDVSTSSTTGAQIASESGVPLKIIGNTAKGHILFGTVLTQPDSAEDGTLYFNGTHLFIKVSNVWQTITTIS